MSVLIKGMTMPTHCEYCGFCRLYRENGRVWCNASNKILCQKWDNPDWTELDIARPDWCPIVTVPDHGDLIDREELKYDLNLLFDAIGARAYGFALGTIDGAPVVVPAEMSEE